jgi:hypothetical protein
VFALLASFALSNAKHDIGKLWAWLCHRSFWQLACMGLAAFALVQHFQLAGERRHSSKLQAQLTKEHAGRLADRSAYESAQREAQAKNKAEVSRIEAEQEKITNEVSDNLNARLERLRRELRSAPNPAAPGSSQGTGASPDGNATGGTDEAPRVCLTPDQLLRGAENEERHDQLITWVEKQLGVKR